MARGFCEGCQTTVPISSTEIPVQADRYGNPMGTSRRWRLNMHNDERPGVCGVEGDGVEYPEVCCEELPCRIHGWPICPKSGDLI